MPITDADEDEWWGRGAETKTLDLRDGFDQILVHGHEIRAVFIIDDDVRETDEQPLFFVDRVRHPVPHGRNQKISHIHAVDRADANANLLAFWHRFLLPESMCRLAFAAQEFLTPAQLLVLVLAHFLAAFFEHAGHTVSPLRARVERFSSEIARQRRDDAVVCPRDVPR